MQDDHPKTPPPVVVRAENFYKRKEIVSTEEIYKKARVFDPLQLADFLRKTFSFSQYMHWLNAVILRHHDDQVEILHIYANSQKADIHLANFFCKRCGGETILTIEWDSDWAIFVCNECGIDFREDVTGKPFSLKCTESINHSFRTMKKMVLLMIKDMSRDLVYPGKPVEMNEINLKVTQKKMSSGLAGQNPGLTQIFAELYQGRLCFDTSKSCFVIWDGHSWTKTPRVWVESLVAVQLDDQLRWLLETLNTRLSNYKKSTEPKSRDQLGMAVLRTRIENMEKIRESITGGTRSAAIVGLLKIHMTGSVLDKSHIKWE